MSERKRTNHRTTIRLHSDDDNQTLAPQPLRKLEIKLHEEDEQASLPEFDPHESPLEVDEGSPTPSLQVPQPRTRDHPGNSIYDYLDRVETQSETQLQSLAGPGSTSSRSSISSRFARDKHLDEHIAWESGSTHSPAPSYHSEKIATLTIELNDKSKTIELLKMARKKDKSKVKQLLLKEEERYQAQLKEQQVKWDKELEKHLDFTQNVVSDKAKLTKRCDELVAELQQANAESTREAERFKVQLKEARERWAAQEKAKREQWMIKKTDEIKKTTVKALEPDIQAILTKGKVDLEKAQETAIEERRKLQIQLEKEHEKVIQRLKEEYEHKLVEAREKERAKLMTRLDAADAELQHQLSSQRRRLQEDAEIARTEMYTELRNLKLNHVKEQEENKLAEAKRMEAALDRFQREKEEMARKYDSDLMALREQTSVECEQFKSTLTSRLSTEMEKQKSEMERQMLSSRDAKIEVIITKLQDESKQIMDKMEHKHKLKLETERKEWERKFNQLKEMEHVWMDKNRDLHDNLSKSDEAREALRLENEQLSVDTKRATDKVNELAKLLHEERRLHEKSIRDLEKRTQAHENDAEYTKQQQNVEIVQLRERLANVEASTQDKLNKQQEDHDTELTSLHERVKATIARKDHVIGNLQDELHLLQIKLEKSQALIEEQRSQLFGDD